MKTKSVYFQLLLCAALLLPGLVDAKVIYVDSAVTGNTESGTAWNTAHRSLSRGLQNAVAGDTVRVAKGTYYAEAPSSGRSYGFVIKSGVVLEGGYRAGTLDRDFTAMRTILSGDVDRNDTYAGGLYTRVGSNALHVLRDTLGWNSVHWLRLDGLEFQGGDANESGTAVNGGGLFLESNRIAIRNCMVRFNRAAEFGGGAYLGYADTLVMSDCRFLDNQAVAKSGGGMAGGFLKSSTAIRSIFQRNSTGDHGGAWAAVGDSINFVDCQFLDGSAVNEGGAIHYRGKGLRVSGTRVENNLAGTLAGGIRMEGNFFSIHRSRFAANRSTGEGGGVTYNGVKIVISDTEFERNKAAHGGGARLYVDTTILTGTRFYRDSATVNGGGLLLGSDTAWLNDVIFQEGWARASGGGFYGGSSVPAQGIVMRNALFRGNQADTGAGIAFDAGWLDLGAGCLFHGNRATRRGGAIALVDGGDAQMRLTRFVGNSADSGGAYSSHDGARLAADSLVFTGNTARVGGAMYLGHGGNQAVTRSAFFGNTADIGGAAAFAGYSRVLFESTTFQGQRARIGGVLAGATDGGVFERCVFQENQASFSSVGHNINATFRNSLFTGNWADTSLMIKGVPTTSSPFAAGPRILYSTLAGNRQGRPADPLLDSIGLQGEGLLVWGNTSNRWQSSQGPVYSLLADFIPGAGNQAGNPLFLSEASGDFRLSAASPAREGGRSATSAGAQLPWPPVDTAGTDLAGNLRLTGPRLDIGAYEFTSAAGLPLPPRLTSAWDSLRVAAGDTLTLSLDSLAAGEGYYARYPGRPLSDLVYQVMEGPAEVGFRIDLAQRLLMVAPSAQWTPGQVFSFVIRASDRTHPEISAERMARVEVVYGGYDLGVPRMSQDDTGVVHLALPARRNVFPLRLQGTWPALLLGTANPATVDLKTLPRLSAVAWSEFARPASRGGDAEWGEYGARFRPDSVTVLSATGKPQGSLRQVLLASATFRRDRKLRLLLPVSDSLGVLRRVYVEAVLDFSNPVTTLQVASLEPRRAGLLWSAFDRPLQSLTLVLEALGTGEDPLRLSLEPGAVQAVLDSLLDSQKYRAVLEAVDRKGNRGLSVLDFETPSGLYALSGRLEGVSTPSGTRASIRLFEEDGTTRLLLREDSVTVGQEYSIPGVRNGRYVLAYAAAGYAAVPAERAVTVFRSDLPGLDVLITPPDLVDTNGVVVRQVPGDGDLEFLVRARKLYPGEEPAQLVLSWLAGEDSTDPGSMTFAVQAESASPLPDGGTLWTLRLPGALVRDSILSREPGFAGKVRYLDSRLITRTPEFSHFREGRWHYPHLKVGEALYAPQTFARPAVPVPGLPRMLGDDAVMSLRAAGSGPSLRARVRFTRLADSLVSEREFDAQDAAGVTLTAPAGGTQVGFLARRLLFETGADFVSPYGAPVPLTGYQARGTEAMAVAAFQGQALGPMGDRAVRPSLSAGFRIPKAGSYWVYAYVERAAAVKGYVYVSVGDRASATIYAIPVPRNATPGWYAQETRTLSQDMGQVGVGFPSLDTGYQAVHLYAPSQNISVAALALAPRVGGASVAPPPPAALLQRAPFLGEPRSVRAEGFALEPDRYYRMDAYLVDRYGNRSDSISLDSLRTVDDLFDGRLTMHQDTGTGDLVLGLNPTERFLSGGIFESNRVVLTQVSVAAGGTTHRINLRKTLNPHDPTEVLLPRSQLPEALKTSPDFVRHAGYRPLSMSLELRHDFVRTTTRTLRCPAGAEGDACRQTCHDEGGGSCACSEKWVLGYPFFSKYSACSWTTLDSTSLPLGKYTRSGHWPPQAGDVASQEFRAPVQPLLDSVSLSSRKAVLAVRNLDAGGGLGAPVADRRQQMSGMLTVTWEPGSLCTRSTTVEIPFGNRFTVNGGQAAFVPSFDGSVASRVGPWRSNAAGHRARHQWLDAYAPGDSTRGGGFLPDLGDSITLAEMQSQSPNVWPRLSTAVRVPAAEASLDSSLAESYRLFVLPGGINGATSHRFTYGIDGRPLLHFEASAENYDTLHSVWLPGPRVWLNSGVHTVDLFMRDDGVRIAGVALMKGDALPGFTRQQLSRFGQEGFDLAIVADQLQPTTRTIFTAEARDRYGNLSPLARREIVTKPLRSLIPGVVITPQQRLENGFHPGGTPEFTFTLEHESEDSLELAVGLQMIDQGSTLGITLPPLTRVSSTTWALQIDSTTPLAPFPREFQAINDSNGYALTAFAFKPDLAGPPAPGDSGALSRLNFGVKPDTMESPVFLKLVDPSYTLKGPVHLTVSRAVAHGDTLKADMSVAVLPEHPGHLNSHLVLEGVTVLCDTVYDDSGNLWYKSIRSVDLQSGRFAAYDCGQSGEDCSRIPQFGLPTGRFWTEVSTDSLHLVELPDTSFALEARGVRVLDDDGSRTRASANGQSWTPLRFNSLGYLDTLFVAHDFFVLRNVLGATNKDSSAMAANPPHLLARKPVSGFSLRSCKTKLWSVRPDDSTTIHYMRLAGECDSCGPFLAFEVKAPEREETAFQVHEALGYAFGMSYRGFYQPYLFDFARSSTVPADTGVSLDYPQGRMVSYAGWNLRLNELVFNARGVHLASVDVALPPEAFPPEDNQGPAFARGIRGLRIGNPFDDPAQSLQILDSGSGSQGSRPWINLDGYAIRNLTRVLFRADGAGNNLELMADGGNLTVPVAKAPGSVFMSPDSLTTTLDSLRITPQGIDSLKAEGELVGGIGLLGNGSPTFRIHGSLLLHTTADGLAAELDSIPGHPLVAMNEDVTLDDLPGGDYPVLEAGMTFGGDFSLRAVTGSIAMGGEANFIPRNFPWLRFPSQAITLTKGGGILQLALQEPSVTFSLGLDPRLFDSTRTQVVLDQNLRLVAFAGRTTLPHGRNSLSDLPGLRGVTGSLGDITMEEFFLGYSDQVGEERVELGAAAQIRLGDLFRPLGLDDRRVRIAWLQASRTSDSTGEKSFDLDTLRARALEVPERFAIGPSNFGGEGDAEYVEFRSSGEGIGLDYARGEFAARMQGFGLRLTESFPLESLRGLRLLLSDFEIRKGLSDPHPHISRFVAAGRWSPPGDSLALGPLKLRGAYVTGGLDKGYTGGAWDQVIDSTQGRRDTLYVVGEDRRNRTGVNAYLQIGFSSLEVGGKTLDLSCNSGTSSLKVYFDGTMSLDLKLRLTDTIPVYPLDNPEVFVLPPPGGACVSVSTQGNSLSLDVEGYTLKSRNNVPGLGRPLDCPFGGKLTVDPARGKFVPERFQISCPADVDFMQTPFEVGLDSVVAGFGDAHEVPAASGSVSGSGKYFYLSAAVKADFSKVMQGVGTGDLVATAGFVGRVANPTAALHFAWRVSGNLKANLAGWPLTAQNVLLSPDTIGFGSVDLDLAKLKDYGLFPCSQGAGSLVIALEDVYWRWQDTSWQAPSINPALKGATCKFEFDLLGNTVGGTVDGSPLFDLQHPRIVIRDVDLTLNKTLGGSTLPTGFALALDGHAPYLHPEFDMPQKLRVVIPSIKLGDKVRLAEAIMELGVEQRQIRKSGAAPRAIETWYFRGKAGLGLPGAVEGLTVDLSLEKPNPPANLTGIRHAKVTLTLSKGARIPIGTTPFYVTGFMGAIYDGYGEPEGLKACRLSGMAPGLKLEAKAYIEFEEPNVAKGDLGFWTHLRELNFGVNGTIEALSGYAEAQACLALYDRGRAFHGNFNVRVDLGVTLDGYLIIDIWNDGRANLAAQGGADVSIKKGLFYKRWWLKIPPFSMTVGGVQARLGRFENGANGYTTGLRVLGRTYGLGVIGGSFVIGGTDKYKLKQPPGLGGVAPLGKRSVLAKAAAAPAATTTAARNPFLGLAGDEVISIIAATDNGDTQWPEDAIKVQTRATDGTYSTDDEPDHYLPVERPVDQGGEGERKENLLLRTWLNALHRKTDSIRILLPVPTTDKDQFDFQVNVALREPQPDFRLRIDTVMVGTERRVKATFSGASAHTQGALRVVSRYDSAEARIDTVLKQKMAPEFFAVRMRLPGIDARNQDAYKPSPVPIPMSSCDGYQEGDESLLDNPAVHFDPDSRTVYLRDLACDITDFPEGDYKFLQSIELFDYIVNSAEGKRVLPDTDRIEVLRLNLTPDTLRGSGGEGVTWTRGPYEKPIPKISRLTGTGSALSRNARGEDERRTVFLNWKPESHPHLAGYRVYWAPQGRLSDTGFTRMAEIGLTSHFAVTLPAIDSAYKEDCDAARDSGNVGGVATSCAGAVRHPAFFSATALDLAVVPVTDTPESTQVYNDANAPSILVPVSRPLWALADTVRNVALGANAGAAKHPLRIALSQGGSLLSTGDTVSVPQSEALSLLGELAVDGLDTSGSADPSDYAELFAEVLGPEGAATPDSVRMAWPASAFSRSPLALGSDSHALPLVVTPVARTKRCREVFEATCRRLDGDGRGNIIDTSDACLARSCEESPDPLACDPNYAHNALPAQSPCNGDPESIVQRATPPGVYTLRVYAQNNGRRSGAVQQGTGYGASVKDSFFVRVLPPKPMLHSANLEYWRYLDPDTLVLTASHLLDTVGGGTVFIRVRSGAQVADFTPTFIRENASKGVGRKEVGLSLAGLTLNAPNGATLDIRVVNSLGLEVESNALNARLIVGAEGLECNSATTLETQNAEYAVDFLGNYPLLPGIDPDDPTKNDTIFIRFTNLFDLNASNYEVKLKAVGGDSIIVPAILSDQSIKLKLPPGLDPGQDYRFITNYINSSSQCYSLDWGRSLQRFLQRKEPVQIRHDEGKVFVISSAYLRTRKIDIREVAGLGKNSQFRHVNLNSAEPAIVLTKPGYVEIQVTDADGHNAELKQFWIDISSQPPVARVNDSILPRQSTLVLGTPLRIPQSGVEAYPPGSAVAITCWRNGDGPRHCGDTLILLGLGRHCPLHLETGWIRTLANGQKDTLFTASTPYCVDVVLPIGSQAFTLPGSRLLKAGSDLVRGEAVLLPLDSLLAAHPTLRADSLRFLAPSGRALPYVADTLAGPGMLQATWVRMDSLPLGAGDFTLTVAPGPGSSGDTLAFAGYRAAYKAPIQGSYFDRSPARRHLPVSGGLSTNLPMQPGDVGLGVSGWIRFATPTIPPGGALILRHADARGQSLVEIRLLQGGQVRARAGTAEAQSLPEALEPTLWHHVALELSFVAGREVLSLYLNGLRVSSVPVREEDFMGYGQGTLVLAQPSELELRDLRIQGRPLQEEVARLHYFSERPKGDFLKPMPGRTTLQLLTAGYRLRGDLSEGSSVYGEASPWRFSELDFRLKGLIYLAGSGGDIQLRTSGRALVYLLREEGEGSTPPPGYSAALGGCLVQNPLTGSVARFRVFRREVQAGSHTLSRGPATATWPLLYAFDAAAETPDIEVGTLPPFAIAHPLTEGVEPFADREAAIAALPAPWRGSVLLQGLGSEKADTSSTYLAFTLGAPGRLGVLYDSAAPGKPDFLNGFIAGGQVRLDNGRTLQVFETSLPAGVTVLPGPRSQGASGNALSYAVVLKAGPGPCVASGPGGCMPFDTATALYSDHPTRARALSSFLRGATLARTRQGDFTRTDAAAFALTLSRSQAVTIALDSNTTAPPTFLTEGLSGAGLFLPVGGTVRNDSGGSYRLYRAFLPAGRHFLSGARSGGETANRWNYLVLASDAATALDTALVLPPTRRPYEDRQDLVLVQVPPVVADLPVVRGSSNSTGCGSRALALPTPVHLVAALHPGWVPVFEAAGWTRKEGVVRWNLELPEYLLYGKDFASSPVEVPLWPCGERAVAPPAPIVFVETREHPKLGLKASGLKVHGIGGTREAVGPTLSLRNLDVTYLPRQVLASASFRLYAALTPGETVPSDTLVLWSPFGDTVLSRGVGGAPQPLAKRTVLVRKHLALADLAPTVLHADSVVVDAYDLSAQGRVRLELANAGGEDVTARFRIVLFEDKDGDFAYDPVREEALGEAQVRGLAAGETLSLAMRLSGKVRFPGKTFLAVVDADHEVVESKEENNALSSRGLCAGFKAPTFTVAQDLSHPRVEEARRAGRAHAVGVLTDDNGDGTVDAADHPVLVEVRGGEVEAVDLLTDSLRWSVALPVALTPQTVRLVDLNATGRPSLLVGDALYSAQGKLMLDATDCTGATAGNGLDFNGDRVAEGVTCEEGVFTVRDGASGKVLKGGEVQVELASLEVLAAMCFDAVLAYPRMHRNAEGAWQVTVRVGNAGGSPLKVGLRLRAEDGSGQRIAEARTDQDIPPDGDLEVTLNLGRRAKGERITVHLDAENRYLEERETNNTLLLELQP